MTTNTRSRQRDTSTPSRALMPAPGLESAP